MPFILEPDAPPADLRGRLGRLRRRARRLAAAAGSAGLAAAAFVFVSLAVAADALLDLPAVLRGGLLVVGLVGGWFLARRRLFTPWHAAGDELAAARQVERHHPELADALTSAVQFNAEPEASAGSPQLKEATALYAVARTRSVDFGEMADARPTVVSVFALLASLAVAVPLVSSLSHPGVGLARLFDPFGEHPWPPQTQLHIEAPETIARGEPFELSATVGDVVPDRATFVMALDGAPAVEHSYPLAPQAGGRESLRIKLEPGRVPRSFRYKLMANDATTGWRAVAVLVPPQLAPLDGRASPRVRLEFPRYTDLLPLDLPDGTGATEAVAGTVVQIQAATDRPVHRAAVECRPADPHRLACAAGVLFADAGPAAPAGYLPATVALVTPTRLVLSDGGHRFGGAFTPAFGGLYELTFTDMHGLTGRRPIDVRVLPDPPPAVTLEQPAVGGDGLEMLPTATVPLRAVIDDPMFAIRRAAVEYRTRPDEAARRILLYDGDQIGRALSTILLAVPLPSAKARPARLEIERRLPLAMFHHAGGRALTTGDVLTLAVIAEDFDDVTPDKPPGRSFEIEIRVVGADRLEARLQKQRAELTKALRDLHGRQAEALALASEAERNRRATGELKREDAERVGKAEALQQQIQDRLGDEREGLRAEAKRLQQAAADNPSVRATAELDRLAAEILPPVKPLLSAARREAGVVPPDQRTGGPLPEAVARQRESEQALRDLIEQAESGAAAAELAVEATALAAEQDKLSRERGELAGRLPPGADPDRLPERDRQELEKLKDRQEALAGRAAGLVGQLDTKAEAQRQAAEAAAGDRAAKLNAEAEALAAARAAARGESPLPDAMKQAADAVGRNQLGVAGQHQQAAARQLDAVRDALRKSRGDDAERLVKDRKVAEEQVDKLTRDQESLQDRTLAAEKAPDQFSRRQALQQLEKEQEQLAERARESARELRRQGQDDAARNLERAARDMEKAREQLERGEPAADRQDDALERLDDAARQAAEARAEAEERLQREKIIKLVARLKGLYNRQAGLAAEAERVFQTAASGRSWPRALQKSLADLGRDEDGLAKEVESVAEKQLQAYKVLRRLAELAARDMAESATAIDECRDAGLLVEAIEADKASVRKPQEAARRRLNQLMEVLQPPKEREGPAGRPGQSSSAPGGNAPAPEGDPVPAAAQLKVLRSMQAELNDRLADFANSQPDPAKWTDAERAAIEALRREQAEIAELFAEVAPDEPPPAEKTNQPGAFLSADEPEPPAERSRPDDAQTLRLRINHNMKALEEKLRRREFGPATDELKREILRDLDELLKQTNPPPQQPPDGQPPPPAAGTPPGNAPDDQPTPPGRGGENQPSGGSRTNQGASNQQPQPGGGAAGREKQPGEQQPSAQPQPGGTRRERRGSRNQAKDREKADQPGEPTPRESVRQPPSDNRPGPRPGEAPGQPGSNPDTAKGATMPPQTARPERLADLHRDVWGHLPESLRQEVDHYYRERFMPRYRDLLQQYYSRLAEVERREREKK